MLYHTEEGSSLSTVALIAHCQSVFQYCCEAISSSRTCSLTAQQPLGWVAKLLGHYLANKAKCHEPTWIHEQIETARSESCSVDARHAVNQTDSILFEFIGKIKLAGQSTEG